MLQVRGQRCPGAGVTEGDRSSARCLREHIAHVVLSPEGESVAGLLTTRRWEDCDYVDPEDMR